MHILATFGQKLQQNAFNCWGKVKFKIEVQDRAVEDVDMPPAPADMTENDFLQWVDIDKNDEVVKKKQLKNEIK